MPSLPEALNPAEVARIARISIKYASNLVDRGELRGYRLAGSNYRRVLVTELYKYLRDNDQPMDLIEDYVNKLCSTNLSFKRRWEKEFAGKQNDV